MMDRKPFVSFVACAACAWPVRTSAFAGRRGLTSRHELRGGDAVLGGDVDPVELADLVEELLRRREVEDRHRRPAERRDSADLHDARDGERLLGPAGDDADRVADLVVLLARRVRVDRHLVRADRPGAADERERVEVLVALRVDAERERRGAASGDDLAVAADEMCEVVDTARGLLHAGELWHLRQQRLRERGRQVVVVRVVAERALRGDDGVRVLVDGREHRAEGGLDRVRQDVGAADHRDAEHDRDRSEDGSQLAAEQALQCDEGHELRLLITVSTSSVLAPVSSLTMRPSAMKRMRSAITAARASCVTMTIVWP